MCQRCSSEMRLDVKCEGATRDVCAGDIVSLDERCDVVRKQSNDGGALLTVLTRGQRISLRLRVAKGSGREHAKWIPCTPVGWHYADSAAGVDGNTDVRFQLELNGTLSGRRVLTDACNILRGGLQRVHADARKWKGPAQSNQSSRPRSKDS